LPDAKYGRFVKEYVSADDASVLVADRAVADYFEAALQQGVKTPKWCATG
jgi:Asp-tRNA(Asn)/Glu-tRNA(Gln) amidotransferase B subunit